MQIPLYLLKYTKNNILFAQLHTAKTEIIPNSLRQYKKMFLLFFMTEQLCIQ